MTEDFDFGDLIANLSVLGYPASGKALSGGGAGLKSAGILTQPGTSQTVSGTTQAMVLATVNFPALPANGAVNARFQTQPTGTGAKTYLVYLNGTLILTAGINPSVACRVDVDIFNQNAQNSQLNEACLYSNSGSAARTSGSSAIDLSGPNILTVAIQLATSTDSCAVNNVRGTLIVP